MALLDEVLEEQNRDRLLFTVREVEDQPDLVKITPYTKGGGCSCGAISMMMPKEIIESVTITEMQHLCCGQSFAVVELHCKEDATMSISDVITQLFLVNKKDDGHQDHHHDHQNDHVHHHGDEAAYPAIPHNPLAHASAATAARIAQGRNYQAMPTQVYPNAQNFQQQLTAPQFSGQPQTHQTLPPQASVPGYSMQSIATANGDREYPQRIAVDTNGRII